MQSKRLFVLLTLLIGGFSSAYGARAEAPVVDLSPTSSQESQINQPLEVDQDEPRHASEAWHPEPVQSKSSTHQNEPMDQRVLRLERQVSNLTEMNYASKLEKMQQEMQQLHGQIEVQNHDLAQLKDQVRNFYQDLDQRLTKIKPNENTSSEKSSLTVENNLKESSKENLTENTENNKTKELQTYEAAFNLLNKKDYEKAINGFQGFVKEYPSSNYTVNAHYWLGEIFYLKNKPEQADKEFQNIITNYPNSAKVADAMLKVALIAMDLGDYPKAKQNLIKVQKQFPSTTAAKIAALRLKEIKQKK